jgi:hypothetical protein
MLIPSSDLDFSHWQIDNIPTIKKGLSLIVSTQCGTDEKSGPGNLPVIIRCRFRIDNGGENVFSCLAEKGFNLFGIKELISPELIIKLIILTHIEFDIDFNIRKMGTAVEFAKLPYRDNKEFVEDAKTLAEKLIDLASSR